MWDSAELSCNTLLSASFNLNLNEGFLDLSSRLLQNGNLDQQGSETVLWRKPAKRIHTFSVCLLSKIVNPLSFSLLFLYSHCHFFPYSEMSIKIESEHKCSIELVT